MLSCKKEKNGYSEYLFSYVYRISRADLMAAEASYAFAVADDYSFLILRVDRECLYRAYFNTSLASYAVVAVKYRPSFKSSERPHTADDELQSHVTVRNHRHPSEIFTYNTLTVGSVIFNI